jgi:hypothetical protein
MDINRPSIQIFSDTAYWSYQHVNQMLHRNFVRRHLDVEFLHRFVMNLPSPDRLLGLLQRQLNTTSARLSLPDKDKRDFHAHGKIKNVSNLPSLCEPMDFLNEQLLLWQLDVLADIAVTFVPSLALKGIFDRYQTLVYYCVHDATKQAYHRRNLAYECELVRRARLVLCDNPVVLARLAQGHSVLDLSGPHGAPSGASPATSKFLLVPPPIPDCFCDLDFSSTKKAYDAIYFGSIHDNIDQEQLKRLTQGKMKVAVVSSQRLVFDSPNLSYFPLQNDFSALARLIALARSILLPYKNSDFMETVSPAKINQVLVTGLPVFCSNWKLAKEHGLLPMDVLGTRRDLEFFTDSYQLDEDRRQRLMAYKESTLLGWVAETIIGAHRPKRTPGRVAQAA